MIKWIKSFFCGKQEALENEVKVLKEKLEQRQEVINQTNAYWKKKLHEATKTSKPPKKKKDL